MLKERDSTHSPLTLHTSTFIIDFVRGALIGPIVIVTTFWITIFMIATLNLVEGTNSLDFLPESFSVHLAEENVLTLWGLFALCFSVIRGIIRLKWQNALHISYKFLAGIFLILPTISIGMFYWKDIQGEMGTIPSSIYSVFFGFYIGYIVWGLCTLVIDNLLSFVHNTIVKEVESPRPQ